MLSICATRPESVRMPPILQARRVQPIPGATGASRPSVSVIVPCYNYGRFLRQSVGSALAQTGVSVDVIIVDDRSTDDSLAVARSLAQSDSRVTVIAHEKNQGPVATFNDGLAKATGQYLVRLDADDLLTPGSLLRSVALLEAFPSVGLVYGHPLHFSGDSLPAARTETRSWTLWPGREWLLRRCQRGVNCITSPEVVMRSSVVTLVGGQKDIAHAHDMEMWMRIALVSDVGHVDGADQAWHREHESSLSARGSNVLVDLFERRQAFDTLVESLTNIEARRLGWLARRALAHEALDRACRAYDRGVVSQRPVNEYVSFAKDTFPGIEGTAAWRRYQWRCKAGQYASKMPWFVLAAILRHVRERYARYKWARTGL